MKKFLMSYKEVIGTLIAFMVLLTPVFVIAAGGTGGTGSAGGTPFPGSSGGTPTPGSAGHVPQGQNSGGGSFQLDNPLKFNSICGLVKGLLQAAMIIGIPIAVLFIVWAGFKFVLAQGKSEDLNSARKNLLWVVIGIAIFLGASLIAQVIMNTMEQLGVQGISSC